MGSNQYVGHVEAAFRLTLQYVNLRTVNVGATLDVRCTYRTIMNVINLDVIDKSLI